MLDDTRHHPTTLSTFNINVCFEKEKRMVERNNQLVFIMSSAIRTNRR
jgi:hypothetical protein